MNLDILFKWVVGVVLAAAALGHLSSFQRWVWTAEAQVIQASKTASWGSPRFFPLNQDHEERGNHHGTRTSVKN